MYNLKGMPKENKEINERALKEQNLVPDYNIE
jgi:hypothetical protein